MAVACLWVRVGYRITVLLDGVVEAVRFSWVPTLVAVGATVATNFYWIYARVGGGFATTVGLAAAVVYLRSTESPTQWTVVASTLLAGAAVVTSWPAAATAALLGLWLWRARGFDRVTLAMATAMVVAALVTVGWILNATTLSELDSQRELRSGGDFTWPEFFRKPWFRASELTPSWYRVAMFPALGAGLALRNTRWVTLLLLAAPLAWTFGGREGAFNHEFWNLPWMPAITVGFAAIAFVLGKWLPMRVSIASVLVAVAVLAVAFVSVVTGPAYDKYFGVAAEAGALLDRVGPHENQELGWVVENVPGARWMSYYWDMPARSVTADSIGAVPPADLVLVRTDLLPAWLSPETVESVVANQGRYALVPGRALQP